MAKIRFQEENHKYLLGEVSLRSVTSILSELSPEFNANYISKGSAYKRILGEDEYKRLRKEVFGFNFKPDQDLLFPIFDPLCGGEDKVKLIQQEFLQEWEDSGTRGTAFHKERELESIARGYEINPWTGRKSKVITYDKSSDNEVYDMDIFSLPDGYYTELLVYDKTLPIENTICGTIDRLWIETIDGVRYSSTGDYKTNSNAPKNDKFARMKPPLEHLWANKITNYSLQASWYQMMLESHGFTPKDAAFTWYKDYDVKQSKDYPVIIMRKEIELIREYVKNLYLPNINS